MDTSWILSSMGAVLLSLLIGCSSHLAAGIDEDLETLAAKKAHHGSSGFTNPWQPEIQPGFFRLLKWKFSGSAYAEAKKNPVRLPVEKTRVQDVLSRGDSITYLGHATVWIRLGGLNILTDPVFGDVWPNVSRHTPFPLSPEALSPVDVVLITHSHYDHLDKESIRRLGASPVYITPLCYRDWFEEVVPGARVVELDWFETMIHNGILFRLLPAQHWTRRNLIDGNRRLWGSWSIETSGKRESRRIFFCGDSAYFFGFKEIGRKYGPYEAAVLPIALYEPRWFMEPMHMDTREAIQAFKDLRAKTFIPEQWGTFDLTDEPLDLPPRVYGEAAREAGFSEEETLVTHGATWYFKK